MAVTRERVERIAKGHPCVNCGEYTVKKLKVSPAPASITEALRATWIARKTCGVCDAEQEIGIDDDGDIVFEN